MRNDDENHSDSQNVRVETASARIAGLCDDCVWVRVQETKRGARFYRCARADTDESYLRYPPLPVLRCAGFTPDDD